MRSFDVRATITPHQHDGNATVRLEVDHCFVALGLRIRRKGPFVAAMLEPYEARQLARALDLAAEAAEDG